jgi:hypothetical protein
VEEVTCPYCGYTSPWTPQKVPVVVRCPNREITGLMSDGKPQYGYAMYGTLDRSRVWVERYRENGPYGRDRSPRLYCRREFRVVPL